MVNLQKNIKFSEISTLPKIIILGESQKLEELISVNKHLKLNTTIITSSNQSKLIDKKIHILTMLWNSLFTIVINP